ncbi:hypothetical protein C5C36_13830 [Rathayibacter sp. AY1G1]|jgi:hypothetical protein|uniref:hypothetical protein n=1 Tax=unclassified Rathayibacter TaxID=2609250 RepID=UPI000CE91648|nr:MULTISPECIES: hypothetical protein [unclassified Rathayibacter]MCJ1685331.1 hypothetical protein [Rathayibacter sp. VKM Ac-2928]PPF32457.1 hypothetical protein C5B93_15485 [Rathayibacter sp. AY1A2]PPH03865.1 hypothetical protein C5C33_14150 [Rathayibacter sp. AY1H3]PPH10641.1 hypothetical protein C5C36_13830 [Rathayibacter sp. AY1G1]PPH35922.1 hypothetical protein C5C86_16490 [Rathayibacter sp. AY1E4]
MSALLAATTDILTTAGALGAVVPDPGPGGMPPGFEAFTTVMGWAKWVGLGVAVVGLIILGVTMTVSARRGEGGEIGGWLGRLLVGVIIVSAAFTIVGFLMGA